MFEPAVSTRSGLSPKTLVLAASIFVLGLGAILYLNHRAAQAPPPLTGVARAGEADFQRYAPQVAVESDIKMAKSFSGRRTVIFAGAITNHSERILDVIEVKLTLFNASDPVHDTIRTPIRPGSSTPAIGAGETRGFTLYLEKFPPEWMASRAEVTLHGLRLEGAPGSLR